MIFLMWIALVLLSTTLMDITIGIHWWSYLLGATLMYIPWQISTRKEDNS